MAKRSVKKQGSVVSVIQVLKQGTTELELYCGIWDSPFFFLIAYKGKANKRSTIAN